MSRHSTPLVLPIRSARIGSSRRPRVTRRSAILITALLSTVLLLGACNSDSSDGGPTGPGAEPHALIEGQGGDVSGVTAVVSAWDAAWNAGDAAGLGALFLDDAEFVNGRGQVARGAAAVSAQHTASLAGPFQGSTTVSRIRGITFLSGAAAVVDVDNDLTGFRSIPPGAVFTEPGLNRQRHKRVVVRQGGVWRVQSMQLTTVAPTP